MTEDELEFDMWDGQFEFFGNNYHNDVLDDREKNSNESNCLYDTEADLVFGPVTGHIDYDNGDHDNLKFLEDNFIKLQMTHKHRKKSFDKTAKNVRKSSPFALFNVGAISIPTYNDFMYSTSLID